VVLFLLSFGFISLVLSIYNKDFNWLSAFGGVSTIFGVLLTVSHSVPKNQEEIEKHIELFFPETRDGVLSEVFPDLAVEKLKNKRVTESERVLKSEALGLLITIIGTIIWAYAGFLTSFFWPTNA